MVGMCGRRAFWVLFFCGFLGAKAQYTCHCKTQCPAESDNLPSAVCQEGCARGFYGMHCQNRNVALERRAWQVSTYTDFLRRFGKLGKSIPNTPDRAVDGNANTFYSRRSCTHTGLTETAPYWTVDLGQAYDLYRMVIYQRSTLTERLTGFEVKVDGRRCYRWESEEAPPIRIPLNCVQPMRGQNVTVDLPKREDGALQILTLCEVLVFACNDYWFGEQCEKTCRCRDPREICNKVTGQCDSGCASGFKGADCQQVSGTNQGASISPRPGRTNQGASISPRPGRISQATSIDLIGGVTQGPDPGSSNGGGNVMNQPTSGQITAITFAVIIALVAAISSLLYFLRWRQSKRTATPDSHYEDLSRPDAPEHRYVTMSDVVRKQSTNSVVKVKTDTESKCRDSENHYDYVVDSEAFPEDQGYLVPIGGINAPSAKE
ncbi:uncharacterized protein LOC124110855 isoform X5 [Haliotis rufescens]|uniref:uncharacterized protein LOC124110855 isoform X5 n=1 Tax=Haliotis rufescens TaxID=6454 RepID=UPI00201E8BE2|nr:uncharacterized protein LOC124110855 isoform X5 [Haliotis rufescens]